MNDREKPKIGFHFQLPVRVPEAPEVTDYWRDPITAAQKWSVMLHEAASKELDKSIGEEILKKAQEEGITDLCVLDAEFCLDAVKEAVARHIVGEMPCMNYCNILAGKNCQLCTKAKEWFANYQKALSSLRRRGLV